MAKFIFTWENLSYHINEKQTALWRSSRKKKLVIDGGKYALITSIPSSSIKQISYIVSGCAFSGSVIAIMGVSGSGKTSLLTLLSGQRRGKGVLKVNGRLISGKMLRNNSAFLQQRNVFMESLTVYEYITFMAAMCLLQPYAERSVVAHKLLKDLNLDNLKFIQIKYLSGGEKRKLSLASSLLLEPYILFCDEPTTGLDSFNAMSVVKILETIAATGKIVFLSVHQPSSSLFNLFDNIILLSNNGKVVFQGSKENAARFFESQSLFCPSSYNPADFYIRNTAIKSPVDEHKVENMIMMFKEHYEVKFDFSNCEYNGLLLKQKTDEKNFFYTLGWLIWRIFIDMKRHLKECLIKLGLILIVAFIISITYSSIAVGQPFSVQNIQGALLLIVSELIFTELYQVIFVFPAEVELFIQEKNLYHALPYFLSKIISLIPFGIIHSGSFLGAYFLSLQFLSDYLLFAEMYLILLGAALGGSALGVCLSAVFPSVESIHQFIVPLELMCLLLSGLWIKIDTLPKVFAIIKYFSPFYVSFESICIVYWMKISEIDRCSGLETIPCFRNGTEVLEYYDFVPNYDEVLKNFLYLVTLITVYCYIGYIGILRKRALFHL